MSEYFPHPYKELLRKLVERLLLQIDYMNLLSLELFVGQLPPDISFVPPLPLDIQLLGSRRHSNDLVEVHFDTSLIPTQLRHFYQEQLGKVGWYQKKDWSERDEYCFVTTASPETGAVVHFCRGPQGPSLNIFAMQGVEAITHVRMYVYTGQDDSPCQPAPEQDARIAANRGTLNLFPRFMPPDGAQHMNVERECTPDSATASALIETESEIPLLTLTAYYSTQLEQAGWIRTNERYSQRCIWQTWSLQEKEKKKAWQGLFFFIKLPDPPNRFYAHAHIHVNSQPETSQKKTSENL